MDLTCYRCKQTKPESEFGLRHDRSKGYKKSCLSCEDPHGTKRCGQCGEIKPKTEFHRTNIKSGHNYWQGECKDCQRQNMRKWRLKNLYNITLDVYEEMFDRQGGGCAICGYAPGDDEVLRVDHDHGCCPEDGRSCGSCVRGLLCNSCNRGIGYLCDSPTRLERAARYLRNPTMKKGVF